MEEELIGYAYYIWMQEQKKSNKFIDNLYRRYNGLIDKETIIRLYYAYIKSYVDVRRTKKLMVVELNKEYNRRRFEKGTCRLIHIGGR